MRGCDVPPRNEKFNDCMYVRLSSLEKRFRLFLLRCMYFMLAGLAVLRLEGC